eukprot:scaffold689_cov166-Pinguiococcus_pyrenoidosus.AAC.2
MTVHRHVGRGRGGGTQEENKNKEDVDDDEEEWPSAEDVNSAIGERSATYRAKASQGGAKHNTWRREPAGGRVEEDAGRAQDTEEEKEEEDDRMRVIQSRHPAR